MEHFIPLPADFEHPWTTEALRLVRREIYTTLTEKQQAGIHLDKEVSYYIDTTDQNLVALGALRPEAPNRLRLVYLAVQPDRRGEGRGSRMLSQLEGVARRAGAVAMTLYLINDRARGFFERRNFTAHPDVETGDLYKQL